MYHQEAIEKVGFETYIETDLVMLSASDLRQHLDPGGTLVLYGLMRASVSDEGSTTARVEPEPRSFHPDDAFNAVDADEAHSLGLITDEMHALATESAESDVKTEVYFLPINPEPEGPET